MKVIKTHENELQIMIDGIDQLEQEIESELRSQIDHNLESGIIKLTGDGYFRYTLRGLFFLWRQFIKDMIRLCWSLDPRNQIPENSKKKRAQT